MMEEVPLSFKEPVFEQGRTIKHMHFVESGVISVVSELDEGGPIETGTVGNEGVSGIPAFLGARKASSRAFCQIAGHALRIRSELMLKERAKNTRLAALVFGIADAFMSMLAQSAACNRAHSVEARMARWLLMTHDRVERDDFPLTQEFLAMMLGVRRPTVNTAGLALQQAGLIQYSRGNITIKNRHGLEASSCECYFYVKRVFENALVRDRR